MHHTVRAAVAAAAVAAVGFGVSAPAASAAPKDRPGHVKVVKAKAPKAKSPKAKHGPAVRTAAFVRNTLRQAAAIQARVDANAPLVDGVAEAAAANQVAAAAVTTAVEKIGAITVDSSNADRKAVRTDLHTARVALGVVADALAAAVEPVTEEPGTEPVTEEPGTEPVL